MNSEDKKNLLVDGENKDDNVSVVHLNKETEQLTDLLLFYWLTSSHDAAVIGNNGHLTSIEIPSTIEWNGKRYAVTSINDRAFENCKKLTSVVIPNTVKSIGEFAFLGCSSLNSIMAPKGFHNFVLKTLKNRNLVIAENISLEEKSGFLTDLMLYYRIISETEVEIVKYRHYLSEISDIPSVIIWNNKCYYVTKICDYAFEGCNSLSVITISTSVKSIGERAFDGCGSLSSITIPDTVTSIGPYAFINCRGLSSIEVAKANLRYDSRENCNAIVETESNTLITGCKNTIIPRSVTTIADGAFEGCKDLTAINLHNYIEEIGCEAFKDCQSLTSVNIPASVTDIGGGAFEGCYGLNSIKVAIGNPRYDSRDNCNAIIETDFNELIIGCKNTYIPSSVCCIGNSAFYGCSNLTSIAIPAKVTSIERRAFYGCEGLTKIKVDRENTKYDSRENCNAIIETSSNCLILGCKDSIIPSGVTSIGERAFSRCKGLISVSIPKGVTAIGENAFEDCSDLSAITIPDSVEEIGHGAFFGCNKLTSISIPSRMKKIGWGAFLGCKGLTSITIPQGVTTIEWEAFADCIALSSITIPDRVTEICAGAFSGCFGLTSVTIPDSVTKIGIQAFEDCRGLKTIIIPNKLNDIGNDAFKGCTCTIRRRDGTTYIPKYIPIKPFDNKQLEDLPF